MKLKIAIAFWALCALGGWTAGGDDPIGKALGSNQVVEEHDVKLKELPSYLVGKWCLVGTDYQRCESNWALDIRASSYVTDTLCQITDITMAPDKTYFVEADCKAEGSDRTVSQSKVSAHLAGSVLHWNEKENLVEPPPPDNPFIGEKDPRCYQSYQVLVKLLPAMWQGVRIVQSQLRKTDRNNNLPAYRALELEEATQRAKINWYVERYEFGMVQFCQSVTNMQNAVQGLINQLDQ